MKTLWVVGLLAAGCAGASNDQLRTRAAFDLKCNAGEVQVIELDDRTRGVQGCGQQATYVESCDGPKQNFNTSCTWVLNSDSKGGR
jgi:hypothetical protein